jgi:hypothetical protein
LEHEEQWEACTLGREGTIYIQTSPPNNNQSTSQHNHHKTIQKHSLQQSFTRFCDHSLASIISINIIIITMKFTTFIASALVPMALALPTDTGIDAAAALEQLPQSNALAELNKVDPANWLEAVKLEAAKQAAEAPAPSNNTLEARSRSDWRYRIESMYSDRLQNVGDVDIFQQTRNRMYDVSNDRGGISDQSRGAWSKFCQPPRSGPTVNIRFVLDGQWGAVNGVDGWKMRDAIIGSMWKTVDEIAIRNRYDVYNDCYGYSWQEAKPNQQNSACGGRSGRACPENSDCPKYGMECRGHKFGTWLPSIMRVNVFNRDNSLRADAYQIRTDSQRLGSGGCGKAEDVAAALAGFVPLAGSYIAAGVKLNCIFNA